MDFCPCGQIVVEPEVAVDAEVEGGGVGGGGGGGGGGG